MHLHPLGLDLPTTLNIHHLVVQFTKVAVFVQLIKASDEFHILETTGELRTLKYDISWVLQQCRQHVLRNLPTTILNNASGIQVHDSKAVAASFQIGLLHALGS